jgi:hypothetical protein
MYSMIILLFRIGVSFFQKKRREIFEGTEKVPEFRFRV